MNAAADHPPRESGIVYEARLENVHALLGWLERACAAADVDEETAFALNLAVEEVCANVIAHGYDGAAPGPLRLSFHADAGQATVVVEDEAPAFDPADAPAPDLGADWEARAEGGLGWHLVYQMVDAVRHEALPVRGNRITLTRRRDTPGR